jgi:hypothetical protein
MYGYDALYVLFQAYDFGAFGNRNVNDRQWASRVETDTADYLFGRIDCAFTPTLPMQFYAQPFVSAGRYDAYKRVASPVTES